MKKTGYLIPCITVCFLCLIVGIFVGRNTRSNYLYVDDVLAEHETNTTRPEDVGKLNINTASVQELKLLPGIGEAMAQRIIDYRTEHGNYQSIEDIKKVSGIGEAKFEAIKAYITAGDK